MILTRYIGGLREVGGKFICRISLYRLVKFNHAHWQEEKEKEKEKEEEKEKEKEEVAAKMAEEKA